MRGTSVLCILLFSLLCLRGVECVAGAIGCGLSFDGTQYLNISGNFPFPTNAYTVEMWAKITHKGSVYQFLFSYAAATATSDNTMNMFHSTEQTICGYVLQNRHDTGISAPTGTWIHLAIAWDTTTGSEDFFINGTKVASKVFAKGKLVGSNGKFVVGQRLAFAKDYLVTGEQVYFGLIDELRIWNVARNASNIKGDMLSTLTGNEANLVGYWPMNTCSAKVGDTIPDMSRNNNNLTYWCVGCQNALTGEPAAIWNIYQELNGPSWTASTNWVRPTTSLNPCSANLPWYGIVCENGYVTQINLAYNNLQGTLSDNAFSAFSRLQYVFLHSNALTGNIPSSLGNFPSITVLYLHDNKLSGVIPETFANLTSATKILLRNNRLSGAIPQRMTSLSKLQYFDVSNNQLDAALPTGLSKMTALLSLSLQNNNIPGALPADLINHPSIKFLSLQNNKLGGVIPNQNNHNAFQSITLDNNQFKCKLPPFIYTSLPYTMNLFNNTFWCPTTGTSTSVFGVTCHNLHMQDMTPTSHLNSQPVSGVALTIHVDNLLSCGDVLCYFSNSTANSTGTFTTPIFIGEEEIRCPLAPSQPQLGSVSLWYNGAQVSSNSLPLNYYLNCPNDCSGTTRGICDQYTGVCSCFPQYTGGDCSLMSCLNNCSGNGNCNYTTGNCTCFQYYSGANCALRNIPCLNGCSGNGTCDTSTGKCSCLKGTWGDDCSKNPCPPYNQPYCNAPLGGECNGVTGQCECKDGWLPPNCLYATKSCPKNCTDSSFGQCDTATGQCICYYPHTGQDCSSYLCANNCSYPNGVCDSTNGNCTCKEYYDSALDCSVYKTNCPNQCTNSTQGVCNTQTGACVCSAGFRGVDCSAKICAGTAPNYCSFPNGLCNNATGICECSQEWTGTFCQIANKTCPNDCTSPLRGRCNKNTGECSCIYPATGLDCSDYSCPNNCTWPYGGVCDFNTGLCICNPDWNLTADCSILSVPCPSSCNAENGGGACDTSGVCVCNPGWSSFGPIIDGVPQTSDVDCSFKVCPGDPVCNTPHGTCNSTSGLCICEPNWIGISCVVPNATCPGGCNEPNGHCDLTKGTCTCYGSWGGANCQALACPNNCTSADRGTCDSSTGVCVCVNGWQTPDCLKKQCPDFCTSSRQGKCNLFTGECSCNIGYSGYNCANHTCASKNYCSGHGTCNPRTGECICDAHYITETCGVANFTCPNDCSGGGTCNKNTGACVCDNQHLGDDCSLLKCITCRNGACNHTTGKCDCDFEWIGADCSIANKSCPSNCVDSDHGVCSVTTGICTCVYPFQPPDCSIAVCPQNCTNGICNTNNGTCACYPGFTGVACSLKECPKNCSNAGICDMLTGVCSCVGGTAGDDCTLKSCPQDCSGHGTCDFNTGMCKCEEGWESDSCNTQQQNTLAIALGAALGGAGAIALASGIFFYIRKRKIDALKKHKAMRMAVMNGKHMSPADAAVDGSNQM